MSEKAEWQAWVWIKWKPGTAATALDAWKGNKVIKNAWSTLGQWDCVLAVVGTSPQELENFVWKTVRQNQWVQDTNTTWASQWW